MKIIFIGGSKTIKALPRGAMEFLDAKLSEGNVRFIVGDSFGVDRAAQIFLASKGADIKVYASEGKVRNNPCNLPVVAVRQRASGDATFTDKKTLPWRVRQQKDS